MSDLGLKATHQRMVIYNTLANREDHPSAEKIFEDLRLNNPSLSLGTVYKTLDTFVSVKLANKVMTVNGIYRYDAKTDFHNHIYCENTGEIMDYENEELADIIQKFFERKKVVNFTIKEVKLQINGFKLDPVQKVLINN